MNISKDLSEKAKTAKTAEELLAMAKAENIEMTEEEAAKAFAKLNKSGELSDEELKQTFGGTIEMATGLDELFPDNGEANYKFEVGQVVDAFYQGVVLRKAKIVRRYTVRLGIMWNQPMYVVEYSGGCAEIEENSIF